MSMETLPVNQPVQGTGEIVLKGGQSISDEQLDSLDAGTESEQQVQVEQEAQKKIAVEERASEMKQEQAKKELAAAIRKWKAITGDGSELDLSSDLKLRIPVNKQETDVTLEELVKSYNGDVTLKKIIPQKFSELDLAKREFDAKRAEVQQKLQRIIQVAPSSPAEAVRLIAQMIHGKEGEAKFPELMEKMSKEAEEWSKLPPEERNRRAETARLELEKQDIERQRQELAAARQREEFAAYSSSVMAERGISEDEIRPAWDEISAQFDGQSGMTPKDKFDATVRYIELKKHYGKIESAVAKVDKDRAADPEYLRRIAKYIDPDFTTDDIISIIKTDLGASDATSTETDSVSKAKPAIKKQAKPATSKPAPSARARATDEEPEDGFLDDL